MSATVIQMVQWPDLPTDERRSESGEGFRMTIGQLEQRALPPKPDGNYDVLGCIYSAIVPVKVYGL
jgi:hypothetical protein